MPSSDSAVDAANAAKKTAALLRDARGVQRRLDKLAVGMADASAPAQRPLSEARDAVARVIAELVLSGVFSGRYSPRRIVSARAMW
jgi:hypothetical protein